MECVMQLPPLPPRPADGHKGTFGSILIIAGSNGMSGAAILSGLGALRAGAGLVTLAIPRSIQTIVASFEPSYLTIPLPDDDLGRLASCAWEQLAPLLERYDAVACGPGWGQSEALTHIARHLYVECNQPLLLDADALNLLAKEPKLPERTSTAPRILTPHPGEFARLLHTDVSSAQAQREELAADFARTHNLTLILKGHPSLITDGSRYSLNTTGNNGMGTGGCGDVLTGIVTALLPRIPPFAAVQLGTHLHGLAGDLAAKCESQPGLIASDLPRFLGQAWKLLGSH